MKKLISLAVLVLFMLMVAGCSGSEQYDRVLYKYSVADIDFLSHSVGLYTATYTGRTRAAVSLTQMGYVDYEANVTFTLKDNGECWYQVQRRFTNGASVTLNSTFESGSFVCESIFLMSKPGRSLL